MRKAQMEAVRGAVTASEQSRPAKFRHTVTHIDRTIARDAERTALNPGKLADYIRRDQLRWERRQADYLDEAGRILGGDPASIERNAIILFY